MPKPGRKNQHNGRHENGLVGPGKRITKQKSNGHINGSPRGATTEEAVPATSSALLNGQATNGTSAYATDSKKDALLDPRLSLKQQDSETSIEGLDNMTNGNAQYGSIDGKHRKSDAVPPKAKSAYDINPVHLASTILRSCPGTDTVALLIFLMALPTMMLTIVQAFFASLTFMPPSGFTPGTLWSFLDLFQSPAGAPSYVTITFVDGICFVLWFCLWAWARKFALDLAQIQIALTLGGGNSGKSSSVNGVCVTMVLLVHLVRSRGVRDFFIGNMLYAKLSAYPSVANILQYLPSQSDFGDSLETPSTIRSIIAVHIIAQALMSYARRSLTNTSGTATTKSSKRTDPEALAGTQNVQDLQTVDSMTSMGSASGVDYQPPPTPGLKDGKDKAVSAKKRRRQANQIRIRQPFWAALASTKVHVMREYEHTRGSYKTSNQQENTIQDASSSDEIVWITGVDSSTINFEAANIDTDGQDDDPSQSASYNKPITVGINGASWQVCLEKLMDDKDTSTRWKGEITGLAPNCTYECSFTRSYDNVEFACISVKTPAISDKDLPKALTPAAMRHSGQPSSPISTIRTSIQSSEAKLAEARNRMTKTRRTHKLALAKVEKDVEALNSRLKSSSDDKKQQQKLLQAERSIKQTEEATAEVESHLQQLAAIPEENSEEYLIKKKDYQERNTSLTTATETLEAAKAIATVEIAAVNSEFSTVTARKERLVGRQAKLTEQYERITEANAQGLNEKERKAAESAAKASEQRRIEREYQEKFSFFQEEMRRYQERTASAWQDVSLYETQERAQRDAMMRNTGPLTPEGNLPGTNPFPPTRFYGFGFGLPGSSIHTATTMPPLNEGQHSPFLAYANTLPDGAARRARSSTNRSAGAGSNFSADFDDADPIPPMPTTYDFDVIKGINGRKGSGSSRGKNNGSPGVIGAGLGSPIRGRNSPGQPPKSIW
jgi:hypothetical protein